MLRKIRIIVAVTFFSLLTLLFLDITGTFHLWLRWLANIQLIPALLAHSIAILVGLVLLTLLFGRIYCSVICPLGIFQDGVSHIAGRRKGKKNRFRYSPAVSWLRYGVAVLFIIALVAGIGAAVSLLDPYAAYGRMASHLFAPLYRWGNNLLAWVAGRFDSYTFYSVDVWLKSGITLATAAVTFLVTGLLAWRNGRTYCNTFCPVGTVLSLFARFSIFRMTFHPEKCTGCQLCERRCKAACIDSRNRRIDYSRCVSCFNCAESCRFGAITYTFRRPAKTPPVPAADSQSPAAGGTLSRRKALSLMALLTAGGAVKAQQLHVDGGLAAIEDKKIPLRKTPIVPAGAQGAAHLRRHCSACQLCISACPHSVLRPSGRLSDFMQPEMSYERGYCRPECTECTQVCPTDAIRPITPAAKSAVSIGHAVWIKDNCVVLKDGVPCTNCQRHCPTGAVTLVAYSGEGKQTLHVPAIDPARCIGCGACEHLCPARPFSAIYVEGNVRHHTL